MILFQITVAILFLVIYGLDINDEDSKEHADVINDSIIVLIFVTLLINEILPVFVCS